LIVFSSSRNFSANQPTTWHWRVGFCGQGQQIILMGRPLLYWCA
jgi:hypothetical protein